MEFKLASQVQLTEQHNPWLIERLLISNGITLIAGLPKTHKSWLIADLAISVASGQPCLGLYQAHDTGTVLMIQGEDPAELIAQRLSSIRDSRKAPPSSLERISILSEPEFRLDNEEHFDLLEQQVKKFKPKLLTIDPLARLIDRPDTSRAALKPVLSKLRAFQKRHMLTLVICTHLTKTSKGELSSISGSGDLRSVYDQAIIMTKPVSTVTRCTFDFKAMPHQPEVFFHLGSKNGYTAPMTLVNKEEEAA
jgi:RecA-family ATPase